jgi:hypothetical protein
MTTSTRTTDRLEASRLTAERLATRLPGYVMLADGEQVVESASFRFSPAHFFLWSRLVLTSRQLGGEQPKVRLGLIPSGSEKLSVPLLNIASAGASTRIQVRQLSGGLVMLALGAGNLLGNGQAWPAPLVGALLCVGACLLLGAFRAVLRVKHHGRGSTELGISILDKGEARAFANRINAVIAGRQEDHDGRQG